MIHPLHQLITVLGPCDACNAILHRPHVCRHIDWHQDEPLHATSHLPLCSEESVKALETLCAHMEQALIVLGINNPASHHGSQSIHQSRLHSHTHGFTSIDSLSSEVDNILTHAKLHEDLQKTLHAHQQNIDALTPWIDLPWDPSISRTKETQFQLGTLPSLKQANAVNNNWEQRSVPATLLPLGSVAKRTGTALFAHVSVLEGVLAELACQDWQQVSPLPGCGFPMERISQVTQAYRLTRLELQKQESKLLLANARYDRLLLALSSLRNDLSRCHRSTKFQNTSNLRMLQGHVSSAWGMSCQKKLEKQFECIVLLALPSLSAENSNSKSNFRKIGFQGIMQTEAEQA